MTLTTEDNWKLQAKYFKPVEDNPVIILIHAQKRSADEWKKLYPEMEKSDYGYLAMDMRGHGTSIVSPSGSTVTYKSFSIGGTDNEFNKMTRDVESAVNFLNSKSITDDRIILMGSVLGANLAIKTAAIRRGIKMVIAISPVTNVNDVLSVNPLRAYGKRPILIIYGASRYYNEFRLLNNIARSVCGRENTTTIVEAVGFGTNLLTRSTIRKIFEWLKHPSLPQVVIQSTATVHEYQLQKSSTENETTKEETDD
jgi:alpha-beta hydrolase superfamily lysophospholipase